MNLQRQTLSVNEHLGPLIPSNTPSDKQLHETTTRREADMWTLIFITHNFDVSFTGRHYYAIYINQLIDIFQGIRFETFAET